MTLERKEKVFTLGELSKWLTAYLRTLVTEKAEILSDELYGEYISQVDPMSAIEYAYQKGKAEGVMFALHEVKRVIDKKQNDSTS